MKKDCYAWKREERKGKEKGSISAHVHMIEDRPKSFGKIEELNVVTHDSDSQDILALDQSSETFYDAQESLCLESTVSVEILISGEISHAWIMDSGASLHVTPHREWFSCYKETVDTVTLGNSYVCDIVGIGNIPMAF